MEKNTDTSSTILIDEMVIKRILFSFFCTFKLWRLNGRYLEPPFSTKVSKCLDYLGYSVETINRRIRSFMRMCDETQDKINKNYELILAGSKAEGVSLPFESDIDVMLNLKNVECVEDLDYVRDNDKHSTIILMNNSTSPQGYTKLNVLQKDFKNNPEIANSIYVLQDGSYLANDEFKKNCSKHFGESATLGTLNQGISGPALNLQLDGFDNLEETHQDIVFSLPCKPKSILEAWVNRTRNYNWPSNELIDHVKVSGIGYLVPVGIKDLDNEWLEWRICFTTVEIDLVHELNDIQRKVYIILKRLSKHIFKSVCDNITSYVLKNLVLWIAEMNPQEDFTEEVLSKRLFQSIVVLRNCVQMEYLPSYMIPERNLLAEKITAEHKLNVIDCLNDCIEQGDELIKNLSWPKFKISLSLTVRELQLYEQYRNYVENIALTLIETYVQIGEQINFISRKGILLRLFEFISLEGVIAYLPTATLILFPEGVPEGDIRRALVERLSNILG